MFCEEISMDLVKEGVKFDDEVQGMEKDLRSPSVQDTFHLSLVAK